jgi:exonuclease III
MLTHNQLATLMTVITTVTLNINGLQIKTRVEMLTSFLRRHEVDILFAQEVTNTEALQIIGYTVYQNIGATMRGTAFLTREGIQLDNIAASPTRRVMAATFHGVLLLNVYSPSGTTMRTEREHFFNSELPMLMRTDYKHVIYGGILIMSYTHGMYGVIPRGATRLRS